MSWKRMIMNSDSPYFPVFLQIIKSVPFGEKSVTKTLINKKRSQTMRKEMKERFRFDFEWQDDDDSICGIEVYKEINNE